MPARTLTDMSAGSAGEELLRSALDALSAHIAVLDASGTIVFVNRAWRRFAQSSGFGAQGEGVGMNYLAVCERAAETSDDARRTAAGLRDIIKGRRSEFRMEYPCPSAAGLRWFQLRVTRPEQARVRRIVVAHEDITDVKRTQAQLARLSVRLMQVQDEERRRIARDLHDTTAQNLLAITLNAARLRERSAWAATPARDVLAEISSLAEQSLQEVRTLSYLLHPPLLDEMGLGAALKWLAKGFSERSGIRVEADIEPRADALRRELATALFRVAQEALSNVHRHSGSTWARVSLCGDTEAVTLEVEDGGQGPKPSLPGESQNLGVGITGMRMRLEQFGGRLEVRLEKSGTLVRASVPLLDFTQADQASRPDPTAP
jgi:PAS domain S-box-containing protein